MLPDDLIANPCLFLKSIDIEKRQVSFVEIAEDSLTGSIDHEFDGPRERVTVDLDPLIDATADSFQRLNAPRFIFMTDFCGSTLLWAALRHAPKVLGLNQISIFADLSMIKRKIDGVSSAAQRERQLADWKKVLRTAVCLTARAFSRSDVVVIKEWPLANYIITDILGTEAGIRAIFLYGDHRDYINAAFRRPWRRELVRGRMLSLAATERLPWSASQIRTFSDAQMFAAHWIIQQRAYLAVDPAFEHRIRSLHAGRVLSADSRAFLQVARHFQLSVSDEGARELCSDALKVHSKTGQPYSFADREREIRETEAAYGAEIREAIDQLAEWADAGISAPERLPWPLPE